MNEIGKIASCSVPRGIGGCDCSFVALGLDEHPFDVSAPTRGRNNVKGSKADRFEIVVPIGLVGRDHDADFAG